MKTVLILTFILLTNIVSGQPEPIMTDLNNDQSANTIFFNSSYNKITISLSEFGKQSFSTKESWVEVDSEFLSSNKNSINSDKLFLKKTKYQMVILLFGSLDGAGYREEFSIINVRNNKVKMVFDQNDLGLDVEIPITIADLDKDGKLDFVFRDFGELYEQVDSLNADIGSYHPYFVYTIDDDCKLNETLTKKYNDDHYVFAGFQYSEKIKILYPRDGSKPRVVK